MIQLIIHWSTVHVLVLAHTCIYTCYYILRKMLHTCSWHSYFIQLVKVIMYNFLWSCLWGSLNDWLLSYRVFRGTQSDTWQERYSMEVVSQTTTTSDFWTRTVRCGSVRPCSRTASSSTPATRSPAVRT